MVMSISHISPKEKVRFLCDLTKLLTHARSGDTAQASQMLSSLLEWLEPYTISDWGQQQKQIIEKAQKRYGLSPVAKLPTQLAGTNVFMPIDEFVKEIRPGVSLVSCCMNRSENLLKALSSWIACKEINEIIIVDWGSSKSVRDEIIAAGFKDPRILVARVNRQPRWILSYAYNFGFRIASCDRILKADADIIIRPGFFKQHSLRPGIFFSGDWRKAKKGQEHINGFFYVWREDLMSVKGFNEYITTYGWDDDDLYFRLEQQGINRVRIQADSIYHIPHDDAQRVGGASRPINALEEMRQNPGSKIMGNRFLVSAMPIWNADRTFTPFTITSHSAGYLEAEQSADSWYQASPHVQADADYYGLAAVLSWSVEPTTVYFIPKERFYALLEARRQQSEITRADVRLAATHPGTAIVWHRRLMILEFDPDVPIAEQLSIATKLLERIRTVQATLVLPAELYDRIDKPASHSGGIQSVLPCPEYFNTHDLPTAQPETLDDLEQAFDTSAAFVARIAKKDMPGLLSNIRAAPTRKDRLYVHVQHGLGNRLRAMASALAICKASGRQPIVIWTPDHHCDCRLSDLFDYDGEVVEEIDTDKLDNADKYTYMEIEPGSCKDAPIRLRKGRDLYIRTAYVINNEHSNWESENAALRSLKPVRDVMELVDSVRADNDLGIHIRMEGAAGTDHNSYDSPENWLPESHRQLNEWRGKSHYAVFIKRLEQRLVVQPDLKIFLAADRPEAYSVFAQRYGDRLSYLPRDRYDRSSQQLRYALADAILLSRCREMLGSTWSSFSELARRLSVTLQKVEMSGIDF